MSVASRKVPYQVPIIHYALLSGIVNTITFRTEKMQLMQINNNENYIASRIRANLEMSARSGTL